MIYLLLSVVLNACIFLFFKLAGRLHLSNLAVIVLNYLVAGLTALLISQQNSPVNIISSDWLIPSFILGCSFVGVFYTTAMATQKAGAAAASVASKMSLLIPVSFAFFFFGEAITFWKIAGICLAIPGIFLAVSGSRNAAQPSGNTWLLLLVFAGCGLIDSFIKVIQTIYLTVNDVIPFTAIIFLSAFMTGSIIILFRLKHFRSAFNRKVLLTGTGLGLVNFGSVYFLIKALQEDGMESSIVFPLNNIGVVILSVILSAMLFREKTGTLSKIGIALCVLSLTLLMMST